MRSVSSSSVDLPPLERVVVHRPLLTGGFGRGDAPHDLVHLGMRVRELVPQSTRERARLHARACGREPSTARPRAERLQTRPQPVALGHDSFPRTLQAGSVP